MHSYSKLFQEILDSSVWQQPLHVKVMWVTMLAMKSPGDQVVRASIPGLAKRAGVTVEQCVEALEIFKAPDPYSRIKDHEGRKIEECREGWLVLNGAEYQRRMSQEDIRAAWREQKRLEREKDGAEPEKEEPPPRKPRVRKEPPLELQADEPKNGSPDHAMLIKLWCEEFQRKFGAPYAVQNGRDGKAVKELLAAGWTPEKVAEVAKKAWGINPNYGADKRCWNCLNRAKTLHDFADAASQIVVELQTESKRSAL